MSEKKTTPRKRSSKPRPAPALNARPSPMTFESRMAHRATRPGDADLATSDAPHASVSEPTE